jgi:cardiolipin synthase
VTFTVPNLLSLLRMGIVPLFIIALLDGSPTRALILFLVAGLTDGLDGFIARFYEQQSALGAYLDPMADKLLLTSAYVCLAIPGLGAGMTIPVWVTVLVIARDVLIVMVALILYLALQVRRFQPAMIGKVTTAVQVTTALAVLTSRIVPALEPLALVLVFATAALTVASGFYYVYRASRLPSPGATDS